jgi:antitoxin VapB
MSLNIKDPIVHAMARQVAATHGISMTGAVREALREKIEKDQAALDSAPRKKTLSELVEEFREKYREELKDVPHSWEINDLLYDEYGLPK